MNVTPDFLVVHQKMLHVFVYVLEKVKAIFSFFFGHSLQMVDEIYFR